MFVISYLKDGEDYFFKGCNNSLKFSNIKLNAKIFNDIELAKTKITKLKEVHKLDHLSFYISSYTHYELEKYSQVLNENFTDAISYALREKLSFELNFSIEQTSDKSFEINTFLKHTSKEWKYQYCLDLLFENYNFSINLNLLHWKELDVEQLELLKFDIENIFDTYIYNKLINIKKGA